jgi:hypothetical protein
VIGINPLSSSTHANKLEDWRLWTSNNLATESAELQSTPLSLTPVRYFP